MTASAIPASQTPVDGPISMFFGPSGRRLYGVYHPATAARGVVVLCPPTGDETPAALRGLRLLARRLAAAGFASLRFDWFATGDSEGAGEEVTWDHWLEDVALAMAHARSLSGASSVTFLGVRMGGALATLAAEACGGVFSLLLWEPVTEGRTFVDQKLYEHRLMLEDEERERPGAAAFGGPDELLGSAFPAALRERMRHVNVGAVRGHVAERMLTVRNRGFGDEGPWYETFQRRAGKQERLVVDEEAPWSSELGFEAAPVPASTIAEIVRWLVEVHA